MRENQSDSEDGWPPPGEYNSPWASREADDASRDGAGGAPAPEEGAPDTTAFGGLASEPGGSADQPWYVAPEYGPDRDQGGYGTGGSGQGGSGAGGYGGYGTGSGSGVGGYGVAGWGAGGPGGPDEPLPGRRRRGGHWLVYLTVAALAAGVGAGLTAALASSGPATAGSVSSRDIPTPRDTAAGHGTLNKTTVEGKVRPGLVDVTATLKYDSETAEGTGMILSPSGLVLTNNHVIDGATQVKVRLAAGGSRSYTAQVIGYDSTDDVALIKIDGVSGLPTVSFGDSSQVRVGIAVLALGDAEGKGGVTPALGAISALNRSIQASDQGSRTVENLNHMLQTSAQIQQGDSGGALANNAGQVIGMVTA
ncbi:MAG: S1C family serine protease, partial [Streptosporangiaceae bacterium]